jgi:murein DD-endopeptidase MepM/ murein hydrolase activator NlpD
MHTGIDIVVNTGNKVYAAGKGKVLRASYNGGYGKTVEIDHGFGYTTLYAHLSKIDVKKGQIVKRGEPIGLSGETGRLATGPHLHYEVKHNGVHLNPKNFIFSDIKVFDSQSKKGSF